MTLIRHTRQCSLVSVSLRVTAALIVASAQRIVRRRHCLDTCGAEVVNGHGCHPVKTGNSAADGNNLVGSFAARHCGQRDNKVDVNSSRDHYGAGKHFLLQCDGRLSHVL